MAEITVKQLKALLAQMPDEALVVLATDVEGNAFSPMGGYTGTARYVAGYRPWLPGEVYTEGEAGFEGGQGQVAVVLWPNH